MSLRKVERPSLDETEENLLDGQHRFLQSNEKSSGTLKRLVQVTKEEEKKEKDAAMMKVKEGAKLNILNLIFSLY